MSETSGSAIALQSQLEKLSRQNALCRTSLLLYQEALSLPNNAWRRKRLLERATRLSHLVLGPRADSVAALESQKKESGS